MPKNKSQPKRSLAQMALAVAEMAIGEAPLAMAAPTPAPVTEKSPSKGKLKKKR